MTQKDETGKARFMTQAEVARELGVSATAARDLIVKGFLAGVTLKPGGRLRTTRKSFEDYCASVEAEGAQRFGGAA